MSLVTIEAVSRPTKATPRLVEWDSLNDTDTYQVKAEGDMLFRVWNNGSTGSATITVTSVAVPAWLSRTGDITQAMAVGTSYDILVPSEGFASNGYIAFAVTGTGADDVDIQIIKNI